MAATPATTVYTYENLHDAKLLRRYKRFLADVRLAGKGASENTQQVHCPNTGPMTGLLHWEEAPVWLRKSDNPKRKLQYTLEAVQDQDTEAWVGVHSALANKMVASMLEAGLLPELGQCTMVQAEATYSQALKEATAAAAAASNVASTEPADTDEAPSEGKRAAAKRKRPAKKAAAGGAKEVASRVDFVVKNDAGELTFVEVKSVTLSEDLAGGLAEGTAGNKGRIALFPDTVSIRAHRHMRDLMDVVQRGHKAACVFVIQRGDCSHFAPCHEKDPEYGQLVLQAAEAGVQIIAVRCELQRTPGGSGQVVLLGKAELQLRHKEPVSSA